MDKSDESTWLSTSSEGQFLALSMFLGPIHCVFSWYFEWANWQRCLLRALPDSIAGECCWPECLYCWLLCWPKGLTSIPIPGAFLSSWIAQITFADTVSLVDSVQTWTEWDWRVLMQEQSIDHLFSPPDKLILTLTFPFHLSQDLVRITTYNGQCIHRFCNTLI